MGTPFLKSFKVGKPRISNLPAASLCSVASSLAMYRGSSKAARVAAASE